MTTAAVICGFGIASRIAVFCLAGAGSVATIAHMLVTQWPKITAAYHGAWFAGQVHRSAPAPCDDVVPESTSARRAA